MKHPGRSLEVQILELLRHRDYFSKFNRVVSADFFAHPATRRIFEEISRLYGDHSVVRLKHTDLLSALKIREKDDDVVKEAGQLLAQMKKVSKGINLEVVKAIAIDWSKRAMVRQALYEGIDLLDRGNGLDLEPIRSRLDVAATLGVDDEQDYSYLDDSHGRLVHEDMVAPVQVGIPEIDDVLQGGLDVGELGLFIGPTHRGKTRALVNLGVHALEQGKHVAHVIVADSNAHRIARRYDSILCNKVFSAIRENPKVLHRRVKALREAGALLVIKEYSKIDPTAGDIRHWLKSYVEKVERKVDLIVLDYLDEMKSERAYKDFRHESRDVTGAVRRLASEFSCPVWTASQGNRKSMEKRQVDLEDVAEDVWKVNRADVVITLNQTEEEKDERITRFRMAKARRENFTPKNYTLEISEAGRITSPEWAR